MPSLTKLSWCRGSVRLYADFYESDIIVASPLALATKITEGEEEEGGAADMLSSIEVLLVAQLDVLQMQNWAHMTTGKYTEQVYGGYSVRWRQYG